MLTGTPRVAQITHDTRYVSVGALFHERADKRRPTLGWDVPGPSP